jgi:hypothetical protein
VDVERASEVGGPLRLVFGVSKVTLMEVIRCNTHSSAGRPILAVVRARMAATGHDRVAHTYKHISELDWSRTRIERHTTFMSPCPTTFIPLTGFFF